MTRAELKQQKLKIITTYQEQLAKGLPRTEAQSLCADVFGCSISKVKKAAKAAKLTRTYVRKGKPTLRPDQKIVTLPVKLVQQIGDLATIEETCYLVVNIPTGIATKVVDKSGMYLVEDVECPTVKDEQVQIPTDRLIPILDSIAKSAPYNERQKTVDELVSKMTDNQKARIKHLLFHQLKKEHYLTVAYKALVKAIEEEESRKQDIK